MALGTQKKTESRDVLSAIQCKMSFKSEAAFDKRKEFVEFALLHV